MSFPIPCTKYGSNPVLAGGDTTHPEDYRGLRAPYFARDAGTWYMLYCGQATESTYPNWQVCLATSTNLKTWTKQGVQLFAGGSKLGGYGTLPSSFDGGENQFYLTHYTVTVSGTCNYIYVYCDGTCTVKVGIYGDGDGDEGAGHPGLLKAAQHTGQSCVSGWNAIKLSSGLAVTTGDHVWLACWYDKVAGDVQCKLVASDLVYNAEVYNAGTNLPDDAGDFGALTHANTFVIMMEMYVNQDKEIAGYDVSGWDKKLTVGGNPFQISTNVLAGCATAGPYHGVDDTTIVNRTVCYHTGTATHLRVHCTHAVNLKWAIYDAGLDGKPKNRLDWWNGSAAACGVGYTDIALSGGGLSLTAGKLYWICYNSDADGVSYVLTPTTEKGRATVAAEYDTYVYDDPWADALTFSNTCDCVSLIAAANFDQWAMVYTGSYTTNDGNDKEVPVPPYQSGVAVADALAGPWWKYNSNPTFRTGTAGDWDDEFVVISWVIENPDPGHAAGEHYLGFYTGLHSGTTGIGLAYSDDLISWTRDSTDGGRIITLADVQAEDPYIQWIENPFVWYDGATWWMMTNNIRDPDFGTGANTQEDTLFHATTFPTDWAYDGAALDSAKLIGQSGSGSTGSTAAETITATGFEAFTTGTITHIHVYCSGAGNVKVGVYDDDGGGNEPGTRLGYTASGTACVAGWNIIALDAGVAVTAGLRYYLAAVSDAAIISTTTWEFGDPGKRYYTKGAGTYTGGMESPWDATAVGDTHTADIDDNISGYSAANWDSGRMGMLAVCVIGTNTFLLYDASPAESHYGGKIGIAGDTLNGLNKLDSILLWDLTKVSGKNLSDIAKWNGVSI